MKNSERHFPIVVGKTFVQGYYEQFEGLYKAVNEYNNGATNYKWFEECGSIIANIEWCYTFEVDKKGILHIITKTMKWYKDEIANGKLVGTELKEFRRGHRPEFIIEEK